MKRTFVQHVLVYYTLFKSHFVNTLTAHVIKADKCFKFSTYCLFFPLKSSCNIQFNLLNNSMFKVQQNSIYPIHMRLDRYWIIQYSKLSDLGCIWEVFYLYLSFICRFRVIRVPIRVLWSLHSCVGGRGSGDTTTATVQTLSEVFLIISQRFAYFIDEACFLVKSKPSDLRST